MANLAPKTSGSSRASAKKFKIRGLWRHSNGYWYYSRMRLGVRKTIALETQDEKEAVQKALDLVDSPELGLAGTFKGEIEAFIKWKVDRNEYSRFTAPQRTKVLEKFMRWAEGQQLAAPQIKTRHIQDFYASERKSVKESTIQSYISSGLSPFFRWLLEERKVISSNPVQGVKMARLDLESSIRDKFCNLEIRDLLLNGWKDVPSEILSPERARWIGFALHAGFEAGLRKNEIIEARPRWFDISGRVLRVSETATFRPKDRERRAVPLSDSFLEFLKEFPMDGEWCIAPKAVRGKADYRYDFEAPFKKYLKWLGEENKQDLSWITPHVMRHTFASLLASAGVSLYKIAKWLGDTHRTAEKHYAHLQASDNDINQLRS